MPADTNRAAAPVVADCCSGFVRLVAVAADFMALDTEWNAMAALPEPLSAFGRHEWFDAAWQWRQDTASLYVLCFYVSERLGAVLPLALRESRARGLRVRELTFLTVPDTQFCDIITAEPYRASAAVAFATELARRANEWDVIRLKYLASGFRALRSSQEIRVHGPRHGVPRESLRSPGLELGSVLCNPQSPPQEGEQPGREPAEENGRNTGRVPRLGTARSNRGQPPS
jgi:hypothetical protein